MLRRIQEHLKTTNQKPGCCSDHVNRDMNVSCHILDVTHGSLTVMFSCSSSAKQHACLHLVLWNILIPETFSPDQPHTYDSLLMFVGIFSLLSKKKKSKSTTGSCSWLINVSHNWNHLRGLRAAQRHCGSGCVVSSRVGLTAVTV